MPFQALPGEFRRYAALKARVLLTDDEKRELEALLEDPALAAKAVSVLRSGATEPDLSWRRIAARIAAIDFVREALTYPSGSGRLDIAEAIQALVTENAPFETRLSLNLKRTLAGDRIELYELLLRYFPDDAHALHERHPGSKIIAFAKRRYERRSIQ